MTEQERLIHLGERVVYANTNFMTFVIHPEYDKTEPFYNRGWWDGVHAVLDYLTEDAGFLQRVATGEDFDQFGVER